MVAAKEISLALFTSSMGQLPALQITGTLLLFLSSPALMSACININWGCDYSFKHGVSRLLA